LRWVARLRYLEVAAGSLARLAADDDVELVHPFLDAGFRESLVSLPRPERFAGRTEAMQALFGGLLPHEVLERETKAGFDAAFWTEASSRVAAAWDGSGVDGDVVDADRLRSEWAAERPDPRSFLLLQSVWLAGRAQLGDGLEQEVDGVGGRLPGLRAS
jgi:asparagine synthase (glutamine-hydrolysing)